MCPPLALLGHHPLRNYAFLRVIYTTPGLVKSWVLAISLTASYLLLLYFIGRGPPDEASLLYGNRVARVPYLGTRLPTHGSFARIRRSSPIPRLERCRFEHRFVQLVCVLTTCTWKRPFSLKTQTLRSRRF